MAMPDFPPRWDDAHTTPVELYAVRYDGTRPEPIRLYQVAPIRVCKACRRSR